MENWKLTKWRTGLLPEELITNMLHLIPPYTLDMWNKCIEPSCWKPEQWEYTPFYPHFCGINAKTTTLSLEGKTAWEQWFERKPDYSYMHEIGCLVFVLILNRHNPKIYERSIEYVLIGYDAKSKCYKCYDQAAKQVYSSYYVRFLKSHEGHSPVNNLNLSSPSYGDHL